MSSTNIFFKNTIYTFVSYLVTAVAQTFVYVYASRVLGGEIFGIWSFLYSGAMVISLSNVGLPNLIISYSAKFLAEKKYLNLYQYFFNCILIFLISFPIVLVITIVMFYFGIKGLKIDSLKFDTIYLFALLFFLQNFTTLVLAFIDGIQKTYVKSTIQLLSNLLFLISGFLLIKKGEINSIIFCQIFLYIFQVIVSVFYVIRFYKVAAFKIRICKLYKLEIVKEIFKSSFNYLLISITTMFFEPLSRYLIGRYLGIATIAPYEVANRIISGVKSLFVNVVQVIFPYLSYKLIDNNINRTEVLKKITNVVFIISVGLFCILPIFFFAAKNQILGQYSQSIFIMILIMTIANFINVISSASYFFALSINQSKLNLWYHFSFFIILMLGTFLMLIFKQYQWMLYLPSITYLLGSCFIIYLVKKCTQTRQLLLDAKNISLMVVVFLLYSTYIIYIKYPSYISVGVVSLISFLFISLYSKALLKFYNENKSLMKTSI